MTEIDIDVGRGHDLDRVARAIEAACERKGLCMTLKRALARYPGSAHWHYRNGRERGTLEITACPGPLRAWFTVRSDRAAGWMDAAIPRLKEDIHERIRAG